MDIKTLVDILIEGKTYLLISLLLFFIELGIMYKLYKILLNKFVNNESDTKRLDLRKNIFRGIFISVALYSFDLTGFPISKTLIDTGILWVVAVIITLSLLYRITIAIEVRFK